LVKEHPKKYKKETKTIRGFWRKVDRSRGNVLLVSSGIVNRILISFSLGIESSRANFMQYPTGLTRIEWVKERGRYRIWYINDTSHLPTKLKIAQQE
jgi:broad specificity phosphatase PhoE